MIYFVIFLYCFFVTYYLEVDTSGVGFKRDRVIWHPAYIIMALLFITLTGLRSEMIGADTQNYYRDFLESPDIQNLDSSVIATSRYQPLWVIFVATIKYYFNSYYVLLFIHAAFVNIVILRFFWKYTQTPFLAALIYYISANYIEFNTEILRESIAICFCLLAYERYLHKKYIFAIVLWVIAYMFHVSCIIALFYPLFRMVKYNKTTIVVSIIVGFTLLSLYPVLSQYSTQLSMFMNGISENYGNMYSFYYNGDINTDRNLNYYILLYGSKLIVPLAMIFYLKEKSNRLIGFVLVYMFLQILYVYSEAFYRFSNYESLFYTMLIAKFIYTFCRKSCSNQLIRILFFTVSIVLFLYIFQQMQFVENLGRSDLRYESYFPHKFFWENQ